MVIVAVEQGGEAYSSTGTVSPYFKSVQNALLPGKLQAASVARVQRKHFENLLLTPETFMSGCISGGITAPHDSSLGNSPAEEQAQGFLAHYTADATGSVDRVCFGQPSGDSRNAVCRQDLEMHGVNYQNDPTLLVQERGIRAVHVRATSLSRGCLRNGTLRAAYGDMISPIFDGIYSVHTRTHSLVSAAVQVHDAAFGAIYDGRLSVFPEDENCTCGTGLERYVFVMGCVLTECCSAQEVGVYCQDLKCSDVMFALLSF